MSPFRILALALPAAAIAAIAAPVAVASAAPAAGQVRAPRAGGLTWHSLKLLNGWQIDSAMGSRSPSWAISGGIVYLGGVIMQSTPGGTTFAQLPVGARPTMTQDAEVPAGGTSLNGYVIVSPTGALSVGPQEYAAERQAVSLAGVSFPVAATIRHKLVLASGWQTVAGGGAPAYTVVGGLVHLSGDFRHSGTGTSTVFATLPHAEAPAHNQYAEVYTQGGITGELVVGSNGNLSVQWGKSLVRTSLASATFPLAGTRLTKLTLSNNWKPAAAALGTGIPSYALSGGIVCLSGAITNSKTTAPMAFATLPPAIRPLHTVFTIADIKNGSGALIGVSLAGQTLIDSSSPTFARLMTSLASVCYPVSA